MIAYGTGDLAGILQGLSLGTSFVHLLMHFKFLIFGIVLLYGVIFWSNYFGSSDALRSFSDFMKAAFWLLYVVFVFTLFSYTYNGSVTFVPTTLDVAMIQDGLLVETPNGDTKFVKARVTSIPFSVPTVFGLLDIADAPVYLLLYKISTIDDPIHWGGNFCSSEGPSWNGLTGNLCHAERMAVQSLG